MAGQQQNVSTRGQMREQSAFLNDVADAVANIVDPVCDGCAIEFDRSGVGLDESNDEAQ